MAPSGISGATLRGDAVLIAGSGRGGKFQQRAGGLDDGRDFADVQEGIAQGAGHLVVDFGDDDAGALRGAEGAVDAGAQAEVAVLVGRRSLDEGDVEGHFAGPEELLDFTEEDGGVVGASGGYCAAHVVAEEQAAVAEVAFVFGQRVIGACRG